MERIKALLVDDHTLIRRMLSERLERERSSTVVGTACTEDEAMERAAEHLPNIIVMDINMPGLFDSIQHSKTDETGGPSCQ